MCLTAGLRVAACPMLKFIIHLKVGRSLKMHFLQTSLLKALTKPGAGSTLYWCWPQLSLDSRLSGT
uniref:Uncharacterized protein n=1 Tax=Molossus molossus TaxID=27622 RepID=A0A7J8B8H7_MOLMO|nr:hypothetical protein HJG59_006577 [Molossus molossus]